nr:MAG TPA: hypothetical protein [Caudoviricetes sp.]
MIHQGLTVQPLYSLYIKFNTESYNRTRRS